MIKRPEGPFFDIVIGDYWIPVNEKPILTRIKNTQKLGDFVSRQAEEAPYFASDSSNDDTVFSDMKSMLTNMHGQYKTFSQAILDSGQINRELYRTVMKAKETISRIAYKYFKEYNSVADQASIAELIQAARSEIAAEYTTAMYRIEALEGDLQHLLEQESELAASL